MDSSLDLVRARREQIARALELLQAEDRELAVAEFALHRLLQGAEFACADVDAADVTAKATRSDEVSTARMRSQREHVRAALGSASDPWMESGQIQAFIAKRWGVSIPTRSLRPLLSFMKTKGEIVRKGRFLALAARKDERSVGTVVGESPQTVCA